MSKKHGARKRRRKQLQKRLNGAQIVMPVIVPASVPAKLMLDVASALNACERAGMPVRFRAGAAWTVHGVVLPPYGGGVWEVRSFQPNPYAAALDDVPADELDD